jgi:predicted dehydrogenase
MILMDDVEPSEKIKVYDKGIDIAASLENETAFTPIYRGGDITIPYLENKEALFVEAKHFIECIQNDTIPLTDGYKGLEVVKILEAADRSIKEGKVIQL